MKIAIRGHASRGKEVIQILESLGGKNKWFHFGNNENCFYELHDDCIWCANTRSEYFKYYTLEEFEKEFPFKIGDRVISATANLRGIITNLKENGWYYVKCDNGHFVCIFAQNLKLYKEMKEERNITLTLDKAKEWYKKGGELKEVALQAFSEEELNPLPRSWEEFCRKYEFSCLSIRYSNFPLKYDAFLKLEQLRDCWRKGWVPDYTKTYKKFRIKKLGTEYIVDWSTGLSDFLVFQTEELAKEFLECFRDLIEKSEDLI